MFQDRAGRFCSKETLYSTLPVLTWGPKYTRTDLLGDVIAGLTVGLTVIPQGIAYGILAGLPANVSGRRGYCVDFVYPCFIVVIFLVWKSCECSIGAHSRTGFS